MKINAFSTTLADDERVGLCFEPKIALANHSCCPNAAVVFNGRTVSLRALDTIRSGEQIFISYIDPTQSTDERLTQLSKRYFFSCQCLKCRGSHSGRGETPYLTFKRYASEGHCVGSPPRMEVLCNLNNAISTATVCRARSNPFLTYNWNIDTKLDYRNASIISIPTRLSKLNSQ
jgi:SET and MYND domain-containing protein